MNWVELGYLGAVVGMTLVNFGLMTFNFCYMHKIDRARRELEREMQVAQMIRARLKASGLPQPSRWEQN